jgi:hypothetical protein
MSASSPKANPENPHSRRAGPVPDLELTRQRRDAGYLKSLLEDFELGRSGLQKRREASTTPQVSGSSDLSAEFQDTAAEFVLGRMQDMVLSESRVDQPSLFPMRRPVPDVGVVGTDRRPPLQSPKLGPVGPASAAVHAQGLNPEGEGISSVQNAAVEVSDTPRHTARNLTLLSALKSVVESARQAPIRSKSLFSRLWSDASSWFQLPAVKQVLGNVTKRRAELIRSVLTRWISLLSPVWRNPLPSWQSAWTRRQSWRPVISNPSSSLLRGAPRAQTSEGLKVACQSSPALSARQASKWAFGGTPWVVAFSVIIAVLASAQAYYLWWPALHTRGQAEEVITPQLRVSSTISNQTPGSQPLKPELTLKSVSTERHDQGAQGFPPSAGVAPPAVGSSMQAPANRAKPNSGLSKHAAISHRSRHRNSRHKTHKLS